MKWEPNIVGFPISVWPTRAAMPLVEGVPLDQVPLATAVPNIMDLSDNIMLAHYQQDRS